MLLDMLDLSVAFDRVDHEILLNRLERCYIANQSITYRWLKSYLTDITQCVHYNGHMSHAEEKYYGVPQGSVLGPLLILLYTADINNAVDSHGHLEMPVRLRNNIEISEQTSEPHWTFRMT